MIFGSKRFKGSGYGSGGGEVEGSGVVVEMEVRRKSGRGVKEVFVLFTDHKSKKATGGTKTAGPGSTARISLLDDHPLFAAPDMRGTVGGGDAIGGEESAGETTFNLGLTEKQRRDREGIVLPYFDAQSGNGVGEGGRILYEMDRGDDFDEEEDEV